jgi:hypothetical protein
MAWIPGRLVVDHHLDPAFLGGRADPLRVRVAHGERLLHHHVHAVGGCQLDDLGMIVSIGESRYGFRLRRRDHRAGIGEEHRLRQLVSFGILPEECRVGVEHADYLDVRARLRGLQEPADMSMHEAGDRQAQWRLRSLLMT